MRISDGSSDLCSSDLRVPEFYYRTSTDYPTVEGPQYLAFIAETLKPYIDAHYRTQADKAHTGLAGSSMGGLITFYGGLAYPEVRSEERSDGKESVST